MAHQNETRRAGGAAGLGLSICVAATDSQEPIKSVSTTQAKMLRRRLGERLHALGPTPLAHFLAEIESGADMRTSLETYAALPADLIRAYGGDRFMPAVFAIKGCGR